MGLLIGYSEKDHATYFPNAPRRSTLLQTGFSKESKDQESMQSSTISDPRYYMGKWQNYKEASHTREPRGQSFPSPGDHKAARNRQLLRQTYKLFTSTYTQQEYFQFITRKQKVSL